MTRITITLDEKEKSALHALSKSELREPRQQAALIIRQELERRGLLGVQVSHTLSKSAAGIKQEGNHVAE